MEHLKIDFDSPKDARLFQQLIRDPKNLRILLRKYELILTENPKNIGSENLSERSRLRLDLLAELPGLADRAITFVDMIAEMSFFGLEKPFLTGVNQLFDLLCSKIEDQTEGETIQ